MEGVVSKRTKVATKECPCGRQVVWRTVECAACGHVWSEDSVRNKWAQKLMSSVSRGTVANEIYDILVREGGAHEQGREDFVSSYLYSPSPTEYRFQGFLGFGGKFWDMRWGWYVTCYPEDTNTFRQQKIRQINRRLNHLRHLRYAFWVRGVEKTPVTVGTG